VGRVEVDGNDTRTVGKGQGHADILAVQTATLASSDVSPALNENESETEGRYSRSFQLKVPCVCIALTQWVALTSLTERQFLPP
jgi:hypothetical protein